MLRLGGSMLGHRRGEAAVALAPVELALRHAPTIHEVLGPRVGFQGPRGAVAGPVLRRRAHQPREEFRFRAPDLEAPSPAAVLELGHSNAGRGRRSPLLAWRRDEDHLVLLIVLGLVVVGDNYLATLARL